MAAQGDGLPEPTEPPPLGGFQGAPEGVDRPVPQRCCEVPPSVPDWHIIDEGLQRLTAATLTAAERPPSHPVTQAACDG